MEESKYIKFIKVLVSITLVFLLMFLVGISVTALNPIIEQGGINITASNVLGASIKDSIKNSTNPFNLELANSNLAQFQMIENNSWSIKLQNQTKGRQVIDFVTLKNPNPLDIKLKVDFLIPQELKGKVKIYLEDANDSLIMYTVEQSYGKKTISLKSYQERFFKLRFEFLEDIENSEFIISFLES